MLVLLVCAAATLTQQPDYTAVHAKIHEEFQLLRHSKKESMKLLQEFIQKDSQQYHEKDAQLFIADLLKNDLKLDKVELITVDQNKLISTFPFYRALRTKGFENSPNVIGIWKGKGAIQVDIDAATSAQQIKEHQYRSIILNGHVDVVPVGNISLWSHDNNPYSGYFNETEDRIYGRGSTDMKGGIYSNYLAIKVLKKHLNLQLQGDVIFESVVEEESGGSGTLTTIVEGYKADAAIIPEPTSLKLFPKQQGSMWFRVTIKGVAAHGGTRYEGISALEKGQILISAIQKLEIERNQEVLINEPLYARFKDFPPEKRIPVPINLGKIHGGEWPSSVCELLTIEGRMGIIPGEDYLDAREELRKVIEAVKQSDDYLRETEDSMSLEFIGPMWLPGNVDPQHLIVQTVAKHFESTTNVKAVIESSPWGTDGAYLTELAKVPALIFGPGFTKVAHQTDEFVGADDVLTCAEVIAHTLVDWCKLA